MKGGVRREVHEEEGELDCLGSTEKGLYKRRDFASQYTTERLVVCKFPSLHQISQLHPHKSLACNSLRFSIHKCPNSVQFRKSILSALDSCEPLGFSISPN